MDTPTLLNLAAFPQKDSNVRRKISYIYDTVALATGQTLYRPFTTAPGNIFQRNQSFPLSGQQIFWITSLSCYLGKAITTPALYSALLPGLQSSNVEVYVDSKQYFKIPLIECLSFNIVNQIGNTTTQNLKVNPVTRNKNFVIPILINSASNVVVNLNLDATFVGATGFDASNFQIKFAGILTDKLDAGLSYNPQANNNFQDIAFTMYDTQAISSGNQTTFNFFSVPETNENNYSRILPLSATERFEIQNIEVFVGGTPGATDNFADVLNQRSTNYFSIKVDDVTYHESPIKDYLSLITNNNNQAFNDATPTNTNINITDLLYQSMTLAIPVIIPAQGKVNVTIQQPASSLNVGQNITCMLKGLIKRQLN